MMQGRESEATEAVFCLQAKKPLHSGSYEHRVPKIKNHFSVPGMFICLFICLFVWFNIVIGHLGRPYSTHTAPMPVLTGSVHAHILTKPSRAGFAVSRLELIEPGGETCVYNEARPRERSDRARFLGMPGPFFKSLDSCTYMNPTHGPWAWSLDDRSRLRAGGREQWTILSGTSAIVHGLNVADRTQGITGT